MLHARRDFVSVQERGRRFRRGHLTLLVLPTTLERARVGYTVSRRVGKAVVRNRVRRRLRELVRHAELGLCSGCDHVFIASPSAAAATFAAVREDFTWLMQQAHLWRSPPRP